MTHLRFIVFTLLLSSVAAVPCHSAGLRLGRDVLGGAGGVVAGGALRAGFTIGQVVAGRATSPAVFDVAGFWHERPVLTVDASVPPPELPRAFELGRPAPNPFATRTRLGFAIPAISGPTAVTIRVFDVAGRSVRVLARGPVVPGVHAITWDGGDDDGVPLRNGVYFCAMETASFRAVRRLVLIR